MATSPRGFDGAVLCGGASRRMGRDKALITLDGTALAARVAGALQAAGARSVAAVGGDRGGIESLGLAYVEDRWPGEGPLGGVITALDGRDGEDDVAVLSCDLLRPSADLIGELVVRRRRSGADLAVPVHNGRAQWTHGVWHRRTRARLQGAFDVGVRAVHQAVGDLVVVTVATDREITADANRPDDLRR